MNGRAGNGWIILGRCCTGGGQRETDHGTFYVPILGFATIGPTRIYKKVVWLSKLTFIHFSNSLVIICHIGLPHWRLHFVTVVTVCSRGLAKRDQWFKDNVHIIIILIVDIGSLFTVQQNAYNVGVTQQYDPSCRVNGHPGNILLFRQGLPRVRCPMAVHASDDPGDSKESQRSSNVTWVVKSCS